MLVPCSAWTKMPQSHLRLAADEAQYNAYKAYARLQSVADNRDLVRTFICIKLLFVATQDWVCQPDMGKEVQGRH